MLLDFNIFRMLLLSLGMILSELMLGRWLNPIFGSTVLSWALLISTFLLGLSLGQIYGYLLKKPSITIISFLLALFHGLLPLLKGSLNQSAQASFPPSLWTEVFFHGLWTLPGSALFGLAFIRSYQLAPSTQILRLVIASSLGSFLGVLFFLIAIIYAENIPMDWVFYALAIMFFVISLRQNSNRLRAGISLIAGLSLLLAHSFLPQFQTPGLIYYAESPYSILSVSESERQQKKFRLMKTGYSHRTFDSMISLDTPGKNATHTYTLATAAVALVNNPTSALILGAGVGTMAKDLNQFAKHLGQNLDITELEINPKVIEIGDKYFFREPHKIIISDARRYLATADKQFDLIILNTYQSGIHLPTHLQTTEFFQLVKSKLTPQGIFVTNAMGSINPEEKRLSHYTLRLFATYSHAFGEKNILALAGRSMGLLSLRQSKKTHNFVIIAGNNSVSVDGFARLQGSDLYSIIEDLIDSPNVTPESSGPYQPFTDQTNNSDWLYRLSGI